jgi:hypothetical protein
MDEPESSLPPRLFVFLPCHSLDDLPPDLAEHEAAAILEAWTVGWHPAVLARIATPPTWASLDLPWRYEGHCVGIVPAGMAERFAAGATPSADPQQAFLQAAAWSDLLPSVLAACDALSVGMAAWQDELVDDFYALGLAVLFSERLACRMRTGTDLDGVGFADIVRTAAAAWRDGDQRATRERLAEAFGCLEAVRDHYYPVECWCFDLILLTPETLSGLAAELTQPTAAAVVADSRTLHALAVQPAAVRNAVRQRLEAGTLSAVGSLAADTPWPLLLPEQLAAGLAAAREAWHDAVGVRPDLFAQQSGPRSPLLPQVLQQTGYAGVLWASFDGRQVPDPAARRFRWRDGAAATVEAVHPRLFDARSAAAILAIPNELGDAMDHDHTVVLMACHHAGSTSPWFDRLRCLASWTTLLGRYVTPDTFFEETDHLAESVQFDRDAFPLRLTPDTRLTQSTDAEFQTPVETHAAVLLEAARQCVDAREQSQAVLEDLLGRSPAAETTFSQHLAAGESAAARATGWLRAWWPSRPSADDQTTLTAPGVHLRVHRGTGGIVSVRRGPGGRNLLSQQVALRWPDPAAVAASSWQPPPIYSTMRADAIEHRGDAITSRGELVDPRGLMLASFTQTVSLEADLPAVRIDLTVELNDSAAGLPYVENAPWSRFLACRFAWNENDFCDIERSVQTQLVPTERQRICSPWLLTLVSEGGGLTRSHGGTTADRGTSRLQLFTAGLPWHLRSSPHTLDTVLATDFSARRCTFQLAIGLDLSADFPAALDWAVSGRLQPPPLPLTLPPGVRLTSAERLGDQTGLVGLRLCLLESTGQAQRFHLAFGRPVSRVARRTGSDTGGPQASTDVAVHGAAVECSLARYEWIDLEIWFGEDHHP